MNQNISSTFKKLFSNHGVHRKTAKLIFGADPRNDWNKLLMTFIIFNILILGWSGYLFWRINSGGIFEVTPTTASGTDQNTKTNLSNTLNVYDAREKHFEDIRNAPPKTADPAL